MLAMVLTNDRKTRLERRPVPTYADEFAEVIALLADGTLQVADLTSEIASIDGAPAAFERLYDANTMKILIAPDGP